MKTHLPKKLLVALLAAMATSAVHADDTAGVNISYSDYNTETGRYDATMTVSGSLEYPSPFANGGIVGFITAEEDTSVETSYLSVTAPEGSGITKDNRPLFVQDSIVNISGGTVCYLSAGANSNGGVYGNRTINMTGGVVWLMYGSDMLLGNSEPTGGYYADNPENKPIKSTGSVTINISGGAVTNALGVGGVFSGPSPLDAYIEEHGGVSAFAVGGDATINISGDAVIGGSGMDEFNAAGGRYGSVDGKLTVNVKGGTINSDLYCGARGAVINSDGSKDRAYVGASEINISAGTVNADVYGGNSYTSNGGGAGYTKGDSRIVISGGTIDGTVYGGGDRDEIQGSTSIELSGGTITGDVYAGGANSIVGGDTSVTVSGDSLQVSGTIYGGGKGTCTIGGSQTLNIGTEDSAYSGTLKVADFTDINMVNGTATIAQLTTHAEGTTLTLGSGTTLRIESDFTAEAIIYNGGSLQCSGSLSTDEIILGEDAYTVGESSFYGGDSDNGFEKEGMRSSKDAITAANFSSITDDTGAIYTYDPTSGKAYAEGGVDYATYYINTAEHEATVSEIAEASKDDNGNVQLEQVEMKAGTLNADRSIAVNAAATTDEAGDILLRSTINMSGADTELSGSIADAIVNASGGKLSAELSGTTEMTVTGEVTVSGDNSHTGATTIRGKEAKLTVAHENALGDSVVELAEQATLDLSNLAVDNSINVTGCTLENAENYRGRMGVSGDLKLTGPTTAESVMLMSDGTISGASLRTKALEVNIYRDFVAEFASISSDVTINDGGVIVLYGGTELRISGSLTLGNNTRVVLMDDGGDFAAGDTLVTCLTGTITGDVSALEFIVDREMQDGYVVEITDDRKSIVLAEEEDDTPIVDPDDEEDKPIVGPDVPVQPDPAPVFDQATADVLAQGNWGIFTASRAFVNAVQGQRNNMGCIADGRGTAWAALLGATHDIDGSGAAAGSDTTLFGAAVGVDMQVGKRSSLGVAFGYTDAEVKPGGLSDVDQESGYIALYGEHGLKKFANNSCLSLDWVLSTGTTESSYLGTDWEQDHLQANARLTWTKKVNERFAYNVFGGVEYFASESDRVENCKSGSIQNLRGELGVGVRYVAGKGAQPITDGKCAPVPAPACECVVLYGEVSYINDMVRNNPSIEVNGLRGSGANPGRQGVGVEAGATIRLGEQWSASANYSFNAMDDSNEHVLNIGASRTF